MQLAYGTRDAFDALVYGEQHPGTVDYLRSQFKDVTGTLTEASRKFYDNARTTFEHFNSNAAINFARNAIQALTGGRNVDVARVVYLGELDQLRSASLYMQRWLMANPVVRERYLDQRLDGYSDSYVNFSGLDIGWKHYDYQLVTDGLMTIDDEGDAHWKEFFLEPREGDRHFTLGEKVDIVDSWSAQNVLLKLCEDPTNAEGGQL